MPEEEDKKKKEEYEKLKKQMDELRDELREFRNFNQTEDYSYAGKNVDDGYKALLENADLRKDDEEFYFDRLYPSLEQIESERAERRANEVKDDSINWKKIPNKVYVKEFTENREVVAAQLAQMYGGRKTKKASLPFYWKI